MRVDVQPELKTLDIDGPVNVADFGGEGPATMLLHGLGGSWENWVAVGGALARDRRVIAPDLRGFGLTPAGGKQPATVDANRVLVDALIAEVFGGPTTLVGNSMGGMISILEAAADPDKVSALVLVDPAVPHPPGAETDPVVEALFATYATPGVGEEFLEANARSFTPEELARMAMALCCVDVARVPGEVMSAHITLAEKRSSQPWAHRAFLEAARSLLELTIERTEECDRNIRAVDAPVLVVQGAMDRLIAMSALERLRGLRPDWTYEVLDDVGHMPQLEVPDLFTEIVEPWLGAHAATGGA